MPSQHGVYVYENDTPIIAPIESDSAIQVVVGTAPVNMSGDITKAVNNPLIVYSFAESVKRLGYSNDFKKFTLCQSMDASFRVFNVAPLIFINVLDPVKHKQNEPSAKIDITDSQLVVKQEGVLLDSIKVKKAESDTDELVADEDYVLSFDDNGHVVLTVMDASLTSAYVSYDYLDPSMVTENDIIGGYNASTGTYKGLELIDQIYPRLGVIPGQILAPGWSHNPIVKLIAYTSEGFP